jgi:myo-inositol-1(or 4)-monophosphatase
MDVLELQSLAVQLAADAGEFIRARRPQHVTIADTKSSESDPVTVMDRDTEEFLRTAIIKARPKDAILGEEGTHRPGTSGLTWILDPIDGTVNYVYGIPHYAVSVAVVEGPANPLEWTQIAGAVHSVVNGVTWSAGRGLGSMRDGARISPREGKPLSLSLTGTGFGYDAERRIAQVKVLADVIGEVRDIRRLGSAAIDLCHVADGTLDLMFERGLNPWDFAAGSLIAAEAGATVAGLRGTRATSEMLVAGFGEATEQLIAILERANADSD